MIRNKVRSDGKTVDNELQEAEQAHLVAKAKRVVLVDANGTPYVAEGASTSVQETFGSNSSVSPSQTVALVSYTAVSGNSFRGFYGTGDKLGYYYIEINGSKVYSDKIEYGKPSFHFFLPDSRPLSANDTVVLKVTHEGMVADGSGSFEGGILIQ